MPGWAAATSASSMALSSTKTTLSAEIFQVRKIRSIDPDLAPQCDLQRENPVRPQKQVLPFESLLDHRRIVLAGDADQDAFLRQGRQKLLIQPVQLRMARKVPTYVFRTDFARHAAP